MMKRIWHSSVFFKLLLGIFVFAWVVMLLPNLFGGADPNGPTGSSPEKNFFLLSSNKKEITFFCKQTKSERISEWTVESVTARNEKYTLAFHPSTVPSSVENSLAAVCGMKSPLRLYDVHKGNKNKVVSTHLTKVFHVIDANLQPGIYIVEEGAAEKDNDLERREKELQERERELRRREQEREREREDRQQERERERERKEREESERRENQHQRQEQEEEIDYNKEENRGPEYWERVRIRSEEDRKAFEERIRRPVRQITPPASTYQIMYPNPMRDPRDVDGNITFISGAINIGRRAHAGKNEGEYKFEDDYLQIMRLILSWKKPVTMVMQRKYYEMLVPDIHDQVIIRIVEVEDLRKWKLYPKIEKIRQKKEWQKIAPWLPDSPQAYSDLYNPVIMHKIYWMQEICHLNPFQTKYFMWVDCGVCTTYLTPDMMDFLSRRYEAMMEPGFLATNSPRFGGDEIQGFKRDKLEEYAEHPVSYIMKGGTFGGQCHQLDLFVKYFDEILESSLDEGYLGTEESIYTILFYKYPEMFHEFKQERPEHPGSEALCLMNDRHYWIPAFKEKWIV